MNNNLHKSVQCTLTAIQIISNNNVDDNFQQIDAQLAKLAVTEKPNHHLVLLPENALCFGERKQYLAVAEELGNGPCQTRLSELAKQYNCTLVCGSFPIKSGQPDRVHTTSLVYSNQGELIGHYHKIHLFDADVTDSMRAYRESNSFLAGQQVQVVDCGFAKIGLAICYDVRFPGLFQKLRELGAEIILLPAAFTKVTGQAHWHALLQARAIETQCYVIAAGQGGEHFSDDQHLETRHTFGHSMVINAWGEILSELTTGIGSVQASFDKESVHQIRKKMPVQQHKKFTNSFTAQ